MDMLPCGPEDPMALLLQSIHLVLGTPQVQSHHLVTLWGSPTTLLLGPKDFMNYSPGGFGTMCEQSFHLLWCPQRL